MRTRIAVAAVVGLAALTLGAAPASAGENCSWGALTKEAATSSPGAMGEHASSFAGERRVGLANIVEQGNLRAVCELLSGS